MLINWALSINVALPGTSSRNGDVNDFMKRLATSKSSSEDDCSYKLLLILKFGPEFWLYAVLMFLNVVGQIVVSEISVL